MPTGYTAMIEDRDDVTFPEFAMTCAHAFGALIEMREERLDAPIPEKITPSSYHEKGITTARAALALANALTLTAARRSAREDYERQSRNHIESMGRMRQKVAKYDAMIAEIEAWTPPTKDHIGLKKFMLEQIDTSVEYARSSLAQPDEYKPVEQTGEQYIADAVKSAERNLAYHTDGWAAECHRAAECTAWIKALRDSLCPAVSGRLANDQSDPTR